MRCARLGRFFCVLDLRLDDLRTYVLEVLSPHLAGRDPLCNALLVWASFMSNDLLLRPRPKQRKRYFLHGAAPTGIMSA